MFVIRLSEASVFRSILRGPDDFESTRFSCISITWRKPLSDESISGFFELFLQVPGTSRFRVSTVVGLPHEGEVLGSILNNVTQKRDSKDATRCCLA